MNQDPAVGARAHFNGGFLGTQLTDVSQKIFSTAEGGTFSTRNLGEILGIGEYPKNTEAFPLAIENTFDSLAVDAGVKCIIYSGQNFSGDVLLEKTGPFVIYNYSMRHFQGGSFDPSIAPLWVDSEEVPQQPGVTYGELFPTEVRTWDAAIGGNMHNWSSGSMKLVAVNPDNPSTSGGGGGGSSSSTPSGGTRYMQSSGRISMQDVKMFLERDYYKPGAIAVNSYYPLFTTESASNACQGGDGSSHSHQLNGITYYMPNGLTMGTNQFHGDFPAISYSNLNMSTLFSEAQSAGVIMPNGDFVAPHNISEFYNANLSTGPYISVTSITDSTQAAYLAWLAASASTGAAAQPADTSGPTCFYSTIINTGIGFTSIADIQALFGTYIYWTDSGYHNYSSQVYFGGGNSGLPSGTAGELDSEGRITKWCMANVNFDVDEDDDGPDPHTVYILQDPLELWVQAPNGRWNKGWVNSGFGGYSNPNPNGVPDFTNRIYAKWTQTPHFSYAGD